MDTGLVGGFVVGMLIAIVTTPVGVSGAVFLLPVQVSVLHVPSPAVSPTNLLYNVVSVPGALLRFGRGAIARDLAGTLLIGTLPGVVIGAVVRIVLVPDGAVFRLLVAALLLPLGIWLLVRDRVAGPGRRAGLPVPAVVALGFGAGLAGGVYGIGGGSLIAPVLVGCGVALARVAPAALLSTFVTSCVGAAAFAVMAALGRTEAAPDWGLGIALGLGGLLGGYLGAALQPRIPERLLRRGLGAAAIAIALGYVAVAV